MRRLVMLVIALASGVLLSALSGSAHTALAQDKAAERLSLPGVARDLKFERFIKRLNLEDTKRYTFHYKSRGTSLGFKISRKGKRKKALFLARNSATHLEGEVVSYRLARLLRVSRLFNPVDYYQLGPRASALFHKMVDRPQRNKWRKINAKSIKARFARNPKSLPGIVKFRHKRRSQAVDQLAKSGGFNQRHRLAAYMRANGPMPTNRVMTLKRIRRDKKSFPKPRASETELARQLSIIFVIDMLTAQADRFSGGNIEAYAHKDGRLQFIARDNGGATLEGRWRWYKRYASWVSRFDQAFVTRLDQLNAFLQGRAAHHERFTSAEQLKRVLGFTRPASYKTFRAKLKHFSEDHIPKLKRRYGNKIFFRGTGELLLAETVRNKAVAEEQAASAASRDKRIVVALNQRSEPRRRIRLAIPAANSRRLRTPAATVRKSKSRAIAKVKEKPQRSLRKRTSQKRSASRKVALARKQERTRTKTSRRSNARKARKKIALAKRPAKVKLIKPRKRKRRASWKKNFFVNADRQ